MNTIRKKETWIDDIKIFACVLVVLGHFFQSMIKSGIYLENDVIDWFLKTIYYFHVPVFFICSGYLYQATVHFICLKDWGRNIVKKLLSLGIPYLLFSTATWILKTIFSGSVNDEVASLYDVLFLHPISPYWYLYTLLFLFVFIPVIKKRNYYFLGIALAVKLLNIILGDSDFYLISAICQNAIWFVMGMYMSCFQITEKVKTRVWQVRGEWGIILFSILSLLFYFFDGGKLGAFLLGMLACISLFLTYISIKPKKESFFIMLLKDSTWPIFLMHTLFAAPIRSILMKLGISNWIIHTILGLGISIVGPMLVVLIMRQWTWMEIFFYPEKKFRVWIAKRNGKDR